MLCKGLDEDVDHLLLHCQVASLHDCGWWGLIGLEWKGDAKYGEGGVAQLVIQEGGGGGEKSKGLEGCSRSHFVVYMEIDI